MTEPQHRARDPFNYRELAGTPKRKNMCDNKFGGLWNESSLRVCEDNPGGTPAARANQNGIGCPAGTAFAVGAAKQKDCY